MSWLPAKGRRLSSKSPTHFVKTLLRVSFLVRGPVFVSLLKDGLFITSRCVGKHIRFSGSAASLTAPKLPKDISSSCLLHSTFQSQVYSHTPAYCEWAIFQELNKDGFSSLHNSCVCTNRVASSIAIPDTCDHLGCALAHMFD